MLYYIPFVLFYIKRFKQGTQVTAEHSKRLIVVPFYFIVGYLSEDIRFLLFYFFFTQNCVFHQKGSNVKHKNLNYIRQYTLSTNDNNDNKNTKFIARKIHFSLFCFFNSFFLSTFVHRNGTSFTSGIIKESA